MGADVTVPWSSEISLTAFGTTASFGIGVSLNTFDAISGSSGVFAGMFWLAVTTGVVFSLVAFSRTLLVYTITPTAARTASTTAIATTRPRDLMLASLLPVR